MNDLGSVALLSHFDKVLAFSKFTLLKCEFWKCESKAMLPKSFNNYVYCIPVENQNLYSKFIPM